MRTRALQRIFFTPKQGITLGRNVRVQRLSCLSTERPLAAISIGDDSVIYENARIEAYGKGRIEIGPSSIIGDARIYSRARVRLGARVVTSWNVFIQDFDPHPVDPELRRLQMQKMTEDFRPAYRSPQATPPLPWTFPVDEVVIGDDVWIGANVTILKGARIGDGSIVATGSVVTAGHWPSRSVLAGIPAKVVKTVEQNVEVIRETVS